MLAVLFAVADNTDDATVVIVDDATPPTLFTVGNAAVPVKSPANFMIPLAIVVASLPLTLITLLVFPIAPEIVDISSMPVPSVISSGLL